MTVKELMALSRLLAGYLELFLGCFSSRPIFEHFGAYCRGLLSDLPRKSVEPMALQCGTPVRTLQRFLRTSVWDHGRMRDLYQLRLAALPQLAKSDQLAKSVESAASAQLAATDDLATDDLRAVGLGADDLGTIGLIDECSVAKKGEETPGVQRQYCGELGKQENCIVTVHLGVARGLFKAMVDSELFLPESWSNDRERCRAADIPDDKVYRPKWKIALELLDQSRTNGLHFDTLIFDEYYGGKPGFLKELDERDQQFIAEVPKNFRVLMKRPRGRKPKKGWKGKRVDNLAKFSAAWHQQPWQSVALVRLTLADQVWDVRAAQVHLVRAGELTERTYWLIVAHNPATGETKYFLSNAPADTPLDRLLRIAFSRWNIEHLFRVSKSELGFSHFEGRSYVSLMRHLTMCSLLTGFLAEQTNRLREKKSRDHSGTNPPCPRPTLPRLAEEPPQNDRPPTNREHHRLSPAA